MAIPVTLKNSLSRHSAPPGITLLEGHLHMEYLPNLSIHQKNFVSKLESEHYSKGSRLGVQATCGKKLEPEIKSVVDNMLKDLDQNTLLNISQGNIDNVYDYSAVLDGLRDKLISMDLDYIPDDNINSLGLNHLKDRIYTVARQKYENGFSNSISEWLKKIIVKSAIEILEKTKPMTPLRVFAASVGLDVRAKKVWGPDFVLLPGNQQNFIINTYKRAFDFGKSVVLNDIFIMNTV